MLVGESVPRVSANLLSQVGGARDIDIDKGRDKDMDINMDIDRGIVKDIDIDIELIECY